ncbi:hypothetical protein P67b_00043 [Ruegeria phage Tedan]|nr:hypothetical protein P67b_00043 [Ruegeria phage Tedan]
MAELKEITTSVSCRLNTGNYEGTEFFVSLKFEVEDFDDPNEIINVARNAANLAMVAQLARAYKGMGKKVTRADLAKRHGLVGTEHE